MALWDLSRSAETVSTIAVPSASRTPICGSDSADPAAASTAAATSTARESATAAAGSRVRRSESTPEPRCEVADRQARRTRAEIAVGGDPVDRARLVERLGHVQLRALED